MVPSKKKTKKKKKKCKTQGQGCVGKGGCKCGEVSSKK